MTADKKEAIYDIVKEEISEAWSALSPEMLV